MPVVLTSYSPLPGVKECAQAVSEVPGVLFCSPDRFRDSPPHVPRALVNRRGIEVHIYSTGKSQCITVELESSMKSAEVLARIQSLLAQRLPAVVPHPKEKENMPAPPIANVFRGTSHDVIKGGNDFLEFLSQQAGVSKVIVDKINHHARYTGEAAEFEAAGHSVLAYYSFEGKKQKFRVFANEHITVDRLHRRLKKAWMEKHQRGGVGQSSKDEVILPNHVQRRMAQDQERTNGHSAAPPTGRPKFQLTPQRAETYEFLRSLQPDARTDFELVGVTGLLNKQFPGQATNRYAALIDTGLLKPLEIIDAKSRTKRFKVVVADIEVVAKVPTKSITAMSVAQAKPLPVPEPPTPTRDPIPAAGTIDLKRVIDQLSGLNKKQVRLTTKLDELQKEYQRLENEKSQYVRSLKKLRLGVVEKDGEILLRPL